MLGTFIGLVALIIAIGGRCTGPDRTLICSSLHILAGKCCHDFTFLNQFTFLFETHCVEENSPHL
jgi:hypothetical protein